MKQGHADKAAGKPTTTYARFVDGFTRALDAYEDRLVTFMNLGAEKDWRAAAHLAAVRFPERWSLKQVMEHQGAVTTNVQGKVQVQAQPAELRELLAASNDVNELADAIVDRLVAVAIESGRNGAGAERRVLPIEPPRSADREVAPTSS